MKKIIIVTGTGGHLGTGHFQRMVNLAMNINREQNLSVSIFLPQNNELSLTEKFKDILIENIPHDTDLIIRDMRDSSIEEMKNLKAIAPVLTIDDIGEGRNLANYTLYLLPNKLESPDSIKLNHKLFLYGYNFIHGIESLKEKKSIKKDIDIAIYLGFNPDKELISNIKKSISKDLSSILLVNDIGYAEILCRSKIVVTHFGITMFEAHLCGCKIAALNPSDYHSALTDLVYDEFGILHKSYYTTFMQDKMFDIIEQNLKIINDKVIRIDNILKKINSGNENFIKYICEALYGTV